MQTRRTISPKGRPLRWMRAGSVLISFAAITLLATAFGARFYSGSLSSVLLTLVLIALCIAIYLHIRFLVAARREQRETANVLDATEREFKSIFDNALDGILILQASNGRSCGDRFADSSNLLMEGPTSAGPGIQKTTKFFEKVMRKGGMESEKLCANFLGAIPAGSLTRFGAGPPNSALVGRP